MRDSRGDLDEEKKKTEKGEDMSDEKWRLDATLHQEWRWLKDSCWQDTRKEEGEEISWTEGACPSRPLSQASQSLRAKSTVTGRRQSAWSRLAARPRGSTHAETWSPSCRPSTMSWPRRWCGATESSSFLASFLPENEDRCCKNQVHTKRIESEVACKERRKEKEKGESTPGRVEASQPTSSCLQCWHSEPRIASECATQKNSNA